MPSPHPKVSTLSNPSFSQSSNPSFTQLLKNPIYLLAFGLGSGLAKKMPGTFGTLAAIPLYLIMAHYLPLWMYIALTLIAGGLGIYICQKAAQQLGVQDPGGIVWDEWVGFWITMIAAPLTWYAILFGFILFRIFDIFKPWPVSWADRNLHGGLGIMLDDVIAGIMAATCLQVILYFI